MVLRADFTPVINYMRMGKRGALGDFCSLGSAVQIRNGSGIGMVAVGRRGTRINCSYQPQTLGCRPCTFCKPDSSTWP